MVCGMADVFQSLLQNGRIEVGFLGGAQIDRYGNINTTVVGQLRRSPTVRLPGSGGAAEIAIHARRTVVISRLSRARISGGGGLRHQPRATARGAAPAASWGCPARARSRW